MIEKITDQNLERYDSRLKEWCDRKFFEKGNYGKYQTTEEAGAVAFYPAPNTPLEGKVKFSFKETMPAEGVKGPDNPSTITGIDEISITRCGKNRIKLPYFVSSVSLNGINWTLDNVTGYITANGTATSQSNRFIVGRSQKLRLVAGHKYYLSGCPSNGSYNTYFVRGRKVSLEGQQMNTVLNDLGNGCLWIADEDCYYQLVLVVEANATVSNIVFKPQFELGTTATEYEPYIGNDYTIQLGNTYYGGEIDLATGVMTVMYYVHIFDGTEAITTFTALETNGRAEFALDRVRPFSNNFQYCSHLVHSPSWSSDAAHFYVNAYGSGYSAVLTAPYLTKENFKTWLAQQYTNGTPVKLIYRMYNPITLQLDPVSISALAQFDKYTPRLNTVYTDADSIQISYLKSPIRDEYEKTQTILSLGGNS